MAALDAVVSGCPRTAGWLGGCGPVDGRDTASGRNQAKLSLGRCVRRCSSSCFSVGWPGSGATRRGSTSVSRSSSIWTSSGSSSTSSALATKPRDLAVPTVAIRAVCRSLGLIGLLLRAGVAGPKPVYPAE